MNVGAHDVFEKRERQAGCRTDRLGNRDETRQHVGHLDAGELRPITVPHDHREVLTEVRDQRERMAGVERERCENRPHFSREIPAQILSNLRSPIGGFEQRHLFSGEQRPKLVPDDDLILKHAYGPAAHGLELLLRVVTVRRDVFDPLTQLLQRGGDANHEEFVEIGGRDRQKLHALEQGMGAVPSLAQDTLVELEPAQFPVDVQGRTLEVRRIDFSWGYGT